MKVVTDFKDEYSILPGAISCPFCHKKNVIHMHNEIRQPGQIDPPDQPDGLAFHMHSGITSKGFSWHIIAYYCEDCSETFGAAIRNDHRTCCLCPHHKCTKDEEGQTKYICSFAPEIQQYSYNSKCAAIDKPMIEIDPSMKCAVCGHARFGDSEKSFSIFAHMPYGATSAYPFKKDIFCDFFNKVVTHCRSVCPLFEFSQNNYEKYKFCMEQEGFLFLDIIPKTTTEEEGSKS